MRILIIVLACIQFIVVGITAAVGSFADGGSGWDRIVVTGVHPLAALLLLVWVLFSRLPSAFGYLVMAVLALNVVADAALAAAIMTGLMKGDWWLPLVFAVIPVIALLRGLSNGAKP